MLLCPNCAAQLPPVIWKVVAAFVAAPFAIAAVVIVALRALGVHGAADDAVAGDGAVDCGGTLAGEVNDRHR